MSITVANRTYYSNDKVQLIELVRLLPFSLGNALKYLYRAGLKTGDPTEDLRKGQYYLEDYITNITDSGYNLKLPGAALELIHTLIEGHQFYSPQVKELFENLAVLATVTEQHADLYDGVKVRYNLLLEDGRD